MPRLWSSLPVIVNKRNMSVMSEILSSRRFQLLDKLRIKSPLSEEVSEAILRHTGLREFYVSSGRKKTVTSVLTVICSLEVNDIYLKMDDIKMSGVSPELLAKAVARLDGLDISDTRMTNKRAKAIFTAIIEGSNLTKLNIGFNNLSRVDLGLLAKVVTNLKILDVRGSELTQQQAVAILTSVSEGSSLAELKFFDHDLSGVDPWLLAKVVTNLKKLDVRRTKLTHQQVVAILTAISEGSKLQVLRLSMNNLSSVDPVLLAKVVTRLESLEISHAELTQQQAVAVLIAVSERKKNG